MKNNFRFCTPPSNVHVARYLPLDVVAARCKLVICNGGSLTTYGAFVANAPVLGVCTNLDQLLNMQAVERLGAGISLRAGTACTDDFKRCSSELLYNPNYRAQAGVVGQRVVEFDPAQRFRDLVSEAIG